MDALWLQIVQWLHSVVLHVDAGTAQALAGGAAQVQQGVARLDMPGLLALAAALVVSALLLVVLFKFLRAVLRRVSSVFSGSVKVA